ncbi:hypothetical protein BN59_00992 [Legionella massiliensis]|uniref:Uncharacterized protein n=1 Tax=Legionella massiliensis TaxID=1034943 RepID=A0A078KY91_9GAMM|nr:hypothetical protein [Legionella massiliensis]CDZ76718.1 hypothetical protein BN59_00992 [Legionella massiliensis]CEE12456.1 hypothetical protein BN1094_00992 [Legionella massiliensis]
MFHDQKISIYKGIIQYLLDSTEFSLQRIANMSNSEICHLQLIYNHNRLPKHGKVELNLLKLFSLVVDMELKGEWKARVELK